MAASISMAVLAAYYVIVDPSLYYLTGSTAIGEWYGKGAELLGYVGPILPEQLTHAFAGLSPDGERSLVQSQSGKTRQPAWDMTFSAPKCVSVLWSRLDALNRQRIEALVLEAAKRAIDYINVEALKTRRGHIGSRVESAEGFYALFPHGTSRALDPQLHVHALVMNLCSRQDLSAGSIRSRDLYWHKMAAGALFRAELAYLLATKLGLSIVPNGWKFEIKGVSEALCKEFSKRRTEIERLARQEGWSSPQVLALLALISRTKKRNVPLAECFAIWAAVPDKFGFTQKAAQALLAEGEKKLRSQATEQVVKDSDRNAVAVRDEKNSQLIGAFLQSVDALSASKSHFPERDLVRETATRALACGASAAEILETVAKGVRRFENRIEIHRSDYSSYSTKQNIAAEKELIARATNNRDTIKHVVLEKYILQAIAKSEQKLSKQIGLPVKLTEDQKAGVRHITAEPGDLKLVQGYAGTGKTQLLAAASAAWTAAGYQVFGAAITGRAALGLQNSTGITSSTIELLLRRLQPEFNLQEIFKLAAKQLKAAIKEIYYDGIEARKWLRNPFEQAVKESASGIASMLVGSHKPNKLPECQLTDKTILVVDEASMLPTAVLLALKQECDKAHTKLVLVGDAHQLAPIQAGGPFASLASRVGSCELTTVVRQKQEWMREATSLLIADEPQRALECYAANGALHLARHQRAAMDQLVADFGKLPEHKFASAIALTATNEESRQINAGVQAKRKAANHLGLYSVGLANGERAYVGDRVMLTRNDYRLEVRNGLLATVIGISHPRGLMGSASLTLRLDDHQEKGLLVPKIRTVTIDLNKYPNMQLGYSATTHKVQGITVSTSFVLIGDTMLSKERAFTQLTRASQESKIYAAEAQVGDSISQIAQQLSKSTAKDLAHDHRIVLQPKTEIDRRRGLLNELLSRLTPPPMAQPIRNNTKAELTNVKLARSHTGALWSLVTDVSKLSDERLKSTVAIALEQTEAKTINAEIQSRRAAAQVLGSEWISLPNGERVHVGDRVILNRERQQSTLGTVTYLETGVAILTGAKILVTSDASLDGRKLQSLMLPACEFPRLQLGYATSADKAREMSVDSSFVILPEGGRSPQPIASLLTIAAKDVSIYGVQAYYGPLLNEGVNDYSITEQLNNRNALQEQQSNASKTDAFYDKEVDQKSQIEEQYHLQRANDEQLQLSWEQQFTL
ncbi:MobF family relaxase [Lacipirellula sp.]|uniref:MobF family relaxase n=1 Tax=Lacipirellula sp. TaxID=2691419 RepID=UPI003D0B580B